MSSRPRAVLYCRISQTDPNVEKVADQEKRLRAAADAAGYDVVEVLTDDGISAYSGRFRPAFTALVQGITKGKYDVLMGTHQDRFARSTGETDALLVLCKQHGVTWHTLTAGTADPSSPMQKAMANIAGVLGELESAVKSQRILASQERLAAAGMPKGGRYAFGFEPDLITPREAEAKWVRWAYAQVLEGATIHSITKAFNTAAIPTRGQRRIWSVQAMRDMLVRPRNAGYLVVNGVRQPVSQIQPLVSEEDHAALVAILSDPTRTGHSGPKVRRFIMSGLALCACGHVMRSTTKAGGRAIYRCALKAQYPGTTGIHTSIDAKRLDEEVGLSVFDWVIEHPEAESETGGSPRLGALAIDLAEVNRKRAAAQELALMDGADMGHVRKMLFDLGAQADWLVAEMDTERASLSKSNVVDAVRAGWWDDPEAQTPRLRENRAGWLDYWGTLDMDRRRETVRNLFTVSIKAGVPLEEKVDVLWLN